MKKTGIKLLIATLLLMSFAGKPIDNNGKTRYVLIETGYGTMKVKLYNETPLHRDNFVALVEKGFYDSLLFHRVISNFMVQGGDPESKNVAAGKQLGNGGPGYEIDAEFIPTLIHKKGVIAAARESDQVNPQKKSSGSQFYIVQGQVLTQEQLKQMEDKINFPKRKQLVFDYILKPENKALKQKLDSLQKANDMASLNAAYSEVALKLEPEYQKLELFHYTGEQKNDYLTIGGTPHLDQNYTVFGEVIDGLSVIDSIALVKTDSNNRPLKDVIMKMRVVEE
jgi:cyclophilin family peptidyl-prolyl cis-trans isomerase